MKYNIIINQYELSKDENITIQDASILDWLHNMFGSDSDRINKKRKDGWTWISLSHLIEDMPLLKIKTNSGASKLIKRVKQLGYIETTHDKINQRVYARATDKLQDLYFSKSYKNRTESYKTQNKVLEETDLVPQDIYHNTNNNTTNIILDNDILDIPIKENKITLPISRGNSSYLRLSSIYGTLFNSKFNMNHKTNYGSMIKVFKNLLNDYSEVQIAYLLTIYFNWRGMEDNSDKEENYLVSNTYPIFLFNSNVTKYEVYARNILKVDFDNDIELLKGLNNYFT